MELNRVKQLLFRNKPGGFCAENKNTNDYQM